MNIEELYNKIAPKLTNWLVASGSHYHEACDLVQNTFLKIWKMRDDLRDDENEISGLAFTIARNLRKNAIRNDSRIAFVEEINDEDAGTVEAPPSPSDAEYLRKRITKALQQLPPVLREAFTLFQIAEMSIREIATQTGVTENLVKVRVFRAKEKLREILSDLSVT